jgi:hypothetical protein
MAHSSNFRKARIAVWSAVTSVALMAATAPVLAQTGPGAPAAQSSAVQGVTVKVTPKALGPGGGRWEFAVVLDTHSADLSDDLVQSASLVTDDGRRLMPLSWTGAPPGGHHREGVLAFDVALPSPKTFELHIQRSGEAAPRVFRWRP